MRYYYRLQIVFAPSIDTFNKLTSILGVQPNNNFPNFTDQIPSSWIYEVIEDKADDYFDFINIFLDLLETKYADLEKLNIHRDDLSVWMLYEYDQQCNMEFDPIRLKRLGDNGITLCISCWDSGNEYGSEKWIKN